MNLNPFKKDDKIKIEIICPNCQKELWVELIEDHPFTDDVNYMIKNDSDLTHPTEWSRILYDTFMLSNPEKKLGIIQPIVCHIPKHKNCYYSDLNALFLFYWFYKHEEKLGGTSFRIISVYSDNPSPELQSHAKSRT